MARLTVEDCLGKVGNRFDLVLLAGRRARQLAGGSPPLIDDDNDKPTVIALREIAAGLIDNATVDAIDIKEQTDDLLEQLPVAGPEPAENA